MAEKRIQFSNIVQNQLPRYVEEEFPLISEFLKEYYLAQEFQGGPVDLIQNIDQYTKISEVTNLTETVGLSTDIAFNDETIEVDLLNYPNGTSGFPDSYGLIKIDDEIITYTGKTVTSFTGCVRGFSGISSYRDDVKSDQLVFNSTTSAEHKADAKIQNLSVLFLKEFLLKSKYQLLPGLEDRDFTEGLNQNVFIKQAKDFYKSKGTDYSFEILFKALYNENVRVIRPRDYLFTPSNAHYVITNDLVVEAIDGNPLELENATLFQDAYGSTITKGYAPITSVEKIDSQEGEIYYKFGIDAGYNRDIRVDGAVYGDFPVHPKTKLIGQVSIGSTVLDVDSTLGFPSSGELRVVYSNNLVGVVSYTAKSITQFFGCSNITGTLVDETKVGINTYAYGASSVDGKEVKVRINSVLSEFIYPDTHYYSMNDTAKIKALGIKDTSWKGKNWFYNVAASYNVESISLIDSSDETYQVNLKKENSYRLGDSVILTGSDGIEKSPSSIIEILSAKSFVIKDQGSLAVTDTYTIKRKLLKVESNTFVGVDDIETNVQNVYNNQEDRILVASPSIPSYDGQPLNSTNRSITFSGTFVGTDFDIVPDGQHYLYTGDAVYYVPQKLESEYFDEAGVKKTRLTVTSSLFGGDVGFVCKSDVNDSDEETLIPPNEGLYFIKKVNESSVKLAKSRTDINSSKFISIDNNIIVTNCFIVPYNLRQKTLDSQKIVREIAPPKDTSVKTTTLPGTTGILVNGVEISNYKSNDFVHYGQIDNIEVLSSGVGYDVVNPPLLKINDATGIGATGYVDVNGSLEQIRIIDSGFDYLEIPRVTIVGGSGEGAVAHPNMKLIEHSASFSAQTLSAIGLGATQSTIGFTTYHKFRNAEHVSYVSDGQKGVGGLTTSSNYFASVQDAYTVKLHNKQIDAIAGINTVELTSYGEGTQSLKSLHKKSVVDSINISSPGYDYQYKKRSIASSGISSSLNAVNIANHGYESGEIIKYTAEGTAADGLTSGTEYYVTAVSDNSFKLSSIGTGAVTKDFYYNSKQYIDLTSVGVGTHVFNYQDISITVTGEIGISSVGTDTFECQVQPIFRGEVTGVYLSDKGVGYGSSEILNYVRDPEISLTFGEDAQLAPVVSNGAVTEVVVVSTGKNYNSPCDIEIIGNGVGAVVTPVIEDNKLSSIKVINGGEGYDQQNISAVIIFPGSGAKFKPTIQNWRVNLVKRYFEQFTSDDGYISNKKGLQYSHLYAPRKLRESMFGVDQTGQILYGQRDLKKESGIEVPSTNHSPVIGWAYDGNPIYGPYGYITKEGGTIAQMRSGYSISIKSGRPPESIFPEGFFVEDYSYLEVRDETILDENNGRFCVTPEYPQGTYAYFATVDNSISASSGAFNQYREPIFPYLVGDNYHSEPNSFNFSTYSNQNDYPIDRYNWFRNTQPYNLIDGTLNYKYFSLPNKLAQTIDIKAVNPGYIEKIGVNTGGDNYRVGDSVVFNNQGTAADLLTEAVGNVERTHFSETSSAFANVSFVDGKTVDTISVASSSISGVEVYPASTKGDFRLFTENPHNFQARDVIRVSGISTTSSKIGGSYKVGISTDIFTLIGLGTISTGIGTTGVTGIVTYLNVSGSLEYPNIKENDILGIGTEKVKVLNVDQRLSRIRVIRAVNGTTGSAHTATTKLYEDPRKLLINPGFKTSYEYSVNKQIYFNPSEAVGLGTIAGVGIGSTVYFSNPGAGKTKIDIPTKTIYLPGHDLKTGDQVTYSANGGDGIVYKIDSVSGVATLTDGENLYVGKINDDLIGISTVKVGLGSTGTFVGIASTCRGSTTLFFTGVGSGVYHSFKTNYTPITCKVTRDLVTVSTASTHGLKTNDKVNVNVNPSISTSFTVKYNDYNRRILISPKSFTASDVSTTTSTITIVDHGFITGQKIVHTATTSTGGLVDNGIYFVVKIDDNQFKLSNNHYHSTLIKPLVITLSSASAGTISPINPPVKVYKNSTVEFDVSDASLSYTKQSTLYPAFQLNFYAGQSYTDVWNKSAASKNFEVQRTGITGVTADAKVTLTVDDEIPSILYYRLDPIYESDLPLPKAEIDVDKDVKSAAQVQTRNSNYDGKYTVSVDSSTSFTYTVPNIPEKTSYSGTTSLLSYKTNSQTAYGPIAEFEITDGGKNYYSVPGITTITSALGRGAIAEASSTNIGEIVKTKINDIGFDFPSDKTLRPTVGLPQIIYLEQYTRFKSIGISSVGRGYSIAPKLKVLDGKTNALVSDVDLKYTLGNSQVAIRKNTFGIYDTAPTIIPIHNINGVGISTVEFNTTTKDVTVELAVGFSTLGGFPFSVNDRVLVENISVGVGSTGTGYNSENYGWKLFTINAVDENYGGIGTVSYSLSDSLSGSDQPGVFDPVNSAGRIIPEKYFPMFNIELEPNQYLPGETVSSLSASGIVEKWDPKVGILKVLSSDNFATGEEIKGHTSHSQGVASTITSFNSSLEFGSTSKVNHGWETDSGVLNTNMQRLEDNFYYQNFSYSLRSKVDMSTWDDVVSTLNHTAGFKKFSDFQLETTDDANTAIVGLSTDLTSYEVVNSLIGHGNLNCVSDFDLVRENYLTIGGDIFSNQIIFNNRILQDYYESVGNRVLAIDDISNQFNSNPRATNFSVVHNFDITKTRAQRYITFVRDKRYTAQRQLMVVSLLNDAEMAYINQYARISSTYDQGSFDFTITGTDGQLVFYPTKYKYNDYYITAISYNLDDNFLGIGTTTVGTSLIKTGSVEVDSGTTTTIVSLATTYRSAKILVEINPDSSMNGKEYEFDEINLIHDGTTVDLVDYGQLVTTTDDYASASGFGTYSAYIESGLIKVDFHPIGIGTTAVVNTIQVGLADTTTGIGTCDIKHARIESNVTTISASGSPTENVIARYPTHYAGDIEGYDAAYFIVQVHDTTNNEYQMCEKVVVDDYTEEVGSGECYDTEWGNLTTNAGLGTIGSRLNVSVGSTSYVELVFTPNASIATRTNVYMNALKIQDDSKDTIEFNNGTIQTEFGGYEGTHNNIKRSFNIQHANNNIFDKSFDGSDSDIVSVANDTITIPNHFFVTGEKISYVHSGIGNTYGVGIASTSFAGVGVTNNIPGSDLYVIKINDDKIKIARNVEDSLKAIPVPVDITSVGIGTSHRFISTNQNAKVIVCLDNIIQSPVVSTALTTTLSNMVWSTDDVVYFSGITSFYSADIIKINDEIMKIEGVGIGSTNAIRVRREWLGTASAGHGTDDVVTKVAGNYNIVQNTLNISEAPYGLVPIGYTTNPPDDRDWTGISTSSHFQGRSFMRSGITNSSNETYYKNYIFDDISSQFNGLKNQFTLKSGGSNVTGITSEGVVLINSVFQGRGNTSDYVMEQSSGITSVTFTGSAQNIANDVGVSSFPVGGMILSVGSTEGYYYQPLVAAGGTVTVSTAGTIQSIAIGNSGSGYRAGIQTVNIGIQTEGLDATYVVSIGTATVSSGHVTGIAITNPHIFYKPRTISNVGYNSTTGLSTVTTLTPHGLNLGNQIALSGIAFTCSYSGPKSITGFAYSAASGIATVTTSGNHGYAVDQDVIFTGIAMTCGLDNGESVHYYPRGEDPAYDTAISIASTTATTITLEVGYGGPADQFAHTFVGVGTSAVIGGGDYDHQFVSAATSAVTSGGAYTHSFVSTGIGTITVTGIGSTTPTDATYSASTGELVLTVGSGHTYTTNNTLGIGTNALIFTCSMDNNTSNHAYPRPSDPIISMGTTAITAVTDNTITVNIGASPFVGYNVSDASYTPSTGNLTLTIGNHSLTGPSTHTVNNAQYNPVTGIMTVFTQVGSANSFSSGDKVRFDDNSLTFTCSADNHATNHTYPRPGTATTTDPFSGNWRTITGIGSTSFEVQVLDTVPSTNTGVHTFVSAVSGGLLKIGESVSVATDSLTFRCAMDNYSSLHSYPRSTDPGFSTSLGITSTTANTISLQVGISTIVKYDVSAANYSANVGIMTLTIGAHTLTTGESIKLATESLSFTCTKDSGITTHRYPRKPDPTYSGSRITAVPSSTTFVTHVGISTVETFYKSGGTVQGVIIAPRALNKSTSKSDPAYGDAFVASVLDAYNFTVQTGISTRSHFYARGGKIEKPLKVVFDEPLSYSNLPLYYSSDSVSGIGSNARVDVVVGQGSSVIEFNIINKGYGYGVSEILTVPTGGLTGIPTSPGFGNKEFQLTIDKIFNDDFTGWSVGVLDVLDSFDDKFDGETVAFQLTQGGNAVSIRAAKGSKINVEDVLLVFINDILQVPGSGYTFIGGQKAPTKEGYYFGGGSILTFTEAPKAGDTSKIVFYKGSGSVDVVFKDILETVKTGDDLTIGYDASQGQPAHWQEDPRLVTQIDSTDIVSTTPYFGPGNTNDENLARPVVWCRQTEDKIVNDQEIGKDRMLYEPNIYPYGYIIKSVGIGSTTLYVDNIRPFFNPKNENDTDLTFQNKVTILSQEDKVPAIATCTVSTAGTITAVTISDGGSGYASAPSVVFGGGAVGVGTSGTNITNVVSAGDTTSYDSLYQTTISASGSGSGYAGGFDLGGAYLRFGGSGTPRYALFKSIDATNSQTLVVNGMYGDDSNGGEDPDMSDETLDVWYQLPGKALTPLDTNINNGVLDTAISKTIIPLSSDACPTAQDFSITLPDYVRVPDVKFALYQPGHSGAGYDHYGIKTISYQTFTETATATASITAGVVTSITITGIGTGYYQDNPPPVFIAPPVMVSEIDGVSSYTGDSGIIVGFGTTTSGIGTVSFDFYIPQDSDLRNTNIVSTALTISSINVGDYFVVRDSNIGFASTSITSRDNDNNIIGIGTKYVDNVYQVESASSISTSVTGVTTYVRRVYANLSGIGTGWNKVGITTSTYFGDYSWGKVDLSARTKNNSYNFYGLDGIGVGGTTIPTGIHTSAIVQRTKMLKSKNYDGQII